MFEQSVDIIKTKKRPWSFAVATSVELALLAAMLLAPLVYIAPVRLPPPPNAMTAYWQHAELPKVESSQTRPPRQNFFIRPRLSQVIFQAPVRIPTTVAQINDLSSPAMDIDAGATSGQGDPGGVPGGVIGSVPDTPPPPAESRKENPSRVGPVRVGGGVQEAKLITRVQPAYPQIAKAGSTIWNRRGGRRCRKGRKDS